MTVSDDLLAKLSAGDRARLEADMRRFGNGMIVENADGSAVFVPCGDMRPTKISRKLLERIKATEEAIDEMNPSARKLRDLPRSEG